MYQIFSAQALSPVECQSHSDNFRCSLAESLEQLAAASQRIADLAAKALLDDAARGDVVVQNGVAVPHIEGARPTLMHVFDPTAIEGSNGSELMEKARVAHFEAALEMYG